MALRQGAIGLPGVAVADGSVDAWPRVLKQVAALLPLTRCRAPARRKRLPRTCRPAHGHRSFHLPARRRQPTQAPSGVTDTSLRLGGHRAPPQSAGPCRSSTWPMATHATAHVLSRHTGHARPVRPRRLRRRPPPRLASRSCLHCAEKASGPRVLLLTARDQRPYQPDRIAALPGWQEVKTGEA